MKNIKSQISVLLTCTLVLACSSVSKKQESKFQLRPIQEVTLSNGLKVIYIADHSLPRVSLNLLVKSGSAQEEKGAEGLAALTVSLLESGTAKRSALKIADDFAQLGSSFNESASSDYVMASTAGLADTKEKLLELFVDVTLNPAFAPAEVERKRSQVLAQLQQKPDQPTEYASELFDQVLFGAHPYAHPISGNISSVKKISRDQIRNYYRQTYVPNRSMLAVVGHFDDSYKALIEKSFANWKKSEFAEPALPATPVPSPLAYKLFSKSGLKQTQIRLGQLGIARNNPDFLKLRLANVVLGGAFASRLNQKVRDDLGLTYSISSSFDSRMGTGSFEINTFARNEKVGEAIQSTMEVVRDFHQNGIREEELKAAKALLVGQFPAAIETADRLAFNLLALRVYGIPDSYLTNFFENVNAIRLQDVNAAIRKYIQPDQFKVVVFADEKSVKQELAKVGSFEVQKIQ